MTADQPADEEQRLEALAEYGILDTLAEQAYDDLTEIAAYITSSPIALISLVDRDRQWFKSRVGLAARETPRELAFCAHAVLRPDEPLIVRDTRADVRFRDNPLVTGSPDIRFYLGAPLVTPEHHALGTLCVIDRVPREPTDEQIRVLTALSRQVVTQLELRRAGLELRQAAADREVYFSQLEAYQQKLEAANAALQVDSLTDKLTGVGNRAAFEDRLSEETSRGRRYGSPVSLLMIDIDHYKAFNDTFGHPAGDSALKAVAAALRGLRPSDFIARYGGDEFAVILPATAREGACVMGERLRRAVSESPNLPRPLTVSIGAGTLLPAAPLDADLVAAADQALYAAKERGRNQVAHADSLKA